MTDITSRDKAIITTVKKGKRIGQFRFVLKAGNGENIATSGNESYTALHNCKKVLQTHFPGFEIIEKF